MQIVDAQIHTWGSGLPSNQSHIQVTHFTPAEAIALMDEGGVDAAVVHPPGWDPNSTEMALKAVTDYPGGRGGTSTLKDAAAMTHIPQLVALAKFPNVAVKATGVPHYSGEAYPFPALHPYLRQVYDAFGPQRMFWGTDITKMPCSWRQCVTMFTDELPWLKGRDLELVMGEALCAWWGWKRTPEVRRGAN